MKSQHSEKYLRDNWDRLIKKSIVNDYMNLEEELSDYMKIFDDTELPDSAKDILRKTKAQEIANRAKKVLIDRMNFIKNVNEGNASLGYTTRIQEVQEMHRIVERFEFNCLQLADFNKKYTA